MKLQIHHTQFTALTFIFYCLMGCTKQETPAVTVGGFELEPGFTIELIASEPLISDPVDMEIDEFGRLYVVEMHGYPLDKSGSGKIKILSDSNGDGKFDKSSVFAESLVLPNSIMRWKQGVIVTDAPNVLYFEDTDDDGKADVRDTLLTGFALSNPQHNLSSPLLATDNWIYLAHEGAVGTDTYKAEFGDHGGEIFYPGVPNGPRLPVNAGGRSVRFQPDRHKLEMTSSHSQFGHSFDAWGHHLEVGNADHIFQEMIAQSYVSRNSHVMLSDATQNLSDHGEAAEVFPITQNPQHQLLTDVGVITSACGITAYLGSAFPPSFDSAVFVCEPVSNLIHVDKLKPNGTSFTASRMRPYTEFLASTDPKFRPVNLYVGPDGALYVVDFYRQIIEHPEWMGDEVVKSGELYNDSDKGRIYRISSSSAIKPDWIKGLSLGKSTDKQLIEALNNTNLWWRLNAQRLLLDRKLTSESIQGLVSQTNNKNPMTRLHALWTLEGSGALASDLIKKGLADPVPGIRENAIRLAELHVKSDTALSNLLIGMVNDTDPKVRYQLLCTLGSIDNSKAFDARMNILLHDISDRWVQMAALTGPSSKTGSLLSEILKNYDTSVPAYSSLLRRLTVMIAAGGREEEVNDILLKILRAKTEDAWRGPALDGLAQGFNDSEQVYRLSASEQSQLLHTFFDDPDGNARKAALHLLKATGIGDNKTVSAALQKAASRAADKKQQEATRVESIEFMGIRNPAPHAAQLSKYVDPTEPLPVQLAALRTLSQIPDTLVCTLLLNRWNTFTPELRDASISAFLEDDVRVGILLREIEKGTIRTTDLTWPRKVGLMAQSNIPLRNKARQLFTANTDDAVNAAYKKALQMPGDVTKGALIYEQQCAICHQIRGGSGVSLGPDLGTIHNWSKDDIMANILAPSQSISSGYDLWGMELKNGEEIQGIISSETPSAITLRNAGSYEKTVRREDIKSIKALGMSVMPSGLDKQITVEQMADLLAFLKKNK